MILNEACVIFVSDNGLLEISENRHIYKILCGTNFFSRLYGKNTATYESGSLRRFQGGRTEVIRSCSVASDAYCRAMVEGNLSMETRGQLLRDAITAHRNYTAEVSTYFI